MTRQPPKELEVNPIGVNPGKPLGVREVPADTDSPPQAPAADKKLRVTGGAYDPEREDPMSRPEPDPEVPVAEPDASHRRKGVNPPAPGEKVIL